MTHKVHLPCNGSGGIKKIEKKSDKIEFEPKGSCTFTSFNFTGGTGSPYYPPGFSNKTPLNGVGASVTYDYDGTAIPDSGYPLEYTTSTPSLGNGSATIKNG
jgi:hypothetical protein